MKIVLGGLLSDPVATYPQIFGPNSPLGGANGVQWLEKYPYSLPMLLNFFLLMLCATLVAVGLEEVGWLDWKTGREKLTVDRHWKPARVGQAWEPSR